MKASGARLQIRCFLEGIEVPVIAAQVAVSPNSPAQCVIQMPPTPEGTRLLPRTIVHLFFLDLYDGSSPYVKMRAGARTEREPTTYERNYVNNERNGELLEADTQTDKYKLLFVGELMGFQWTKTPSNRSLILQCQDLSNYWDYAYQWNNTDLFGPGYKALFSGGATNLFTDFLDSKESVISRLIQTPSVQYPKLKGLLGGIVHLLEAIGGSYYAPNQKGQRTRFAGQNIFFSLAELRLHINQLITAYPEDDTVKRLMSANGFDGLMGRTMGNLGEQVSIRSAINALMGIIFHETYAQPCPLYVPGLEGTIDGYVRKKIKDDPKAAPLANAATDLIASLTSIKSFTKSAENRSNAETVVTQQLSLAQRTCSLSAQRARSFGADSVVSMFVSAQTILGRLLGRMKVAELKKSYVSGLPGTVGDAAANTVFSAVSVPAYETVPGRPFFDGQGAVTPDVIKILDEAIEVLSKVGDVEITTTKQKEAVPARLNQQIFRPDIWFSSPIRCNVIFPEQYSEMSYARSFMQEPTRLLLKTNSEFYGEDELFDQFYFAPKALTLKRAKRDLPSILSRDLMGHELFTGIIPVFEKMGEMNIFAVRSGVKDKTLAKVGLAQRSANFMYFKYRFAARQMRFVGRFNPYIACGFPGLVIDRAVDVETVRLHGSLVYNKEVTARTANRLLGTHFLGSFTEVTHSLDQSQGSTTVNCSYPRQPDESVEFLGSLEKQEEFTKERFESNVLEATDVAALEPPPLNTLGPKLGIVSAVAETTVVYQLGGQVGTELPLLAGNRREGTAELSVKVPIGVPKPAKEFGPEVVKLVGSESQVVTFRAFRVEERVPEFREKQVDLPAEEYIRPGWYGDIWHPSSIAKAYEHYFQTGSITQRQQIGDPAGVATGDLNSDAEDALADAANGISYEDPRTQAPALYTLDEGSSIEQAVAFLVATYSYARSGGLDVDEFIKAYTWRPIATMLDVFGTKDLQLSTDGEKIVSGVEGFHSRAFGPFENMFGLVTSEVAEVLDLKRGKDAEIAARLDVRLRRHNAVKEFVSSLLLTQATLG